MKTFSGKSRIKTIIYWTTTGITVAGMLIGGTAQILRVEHEKEMLTGLGYPVYVLSILGTWSVLGGIVLIIPRFVLLKVWVYAGLFFTTTSAAASHLFNSNPQEAVPPVVVGTIAMTSLLLNPTLQGVLSQMLKKTN